MKEQDPRETIMDTWNQLSPAEQDDALITYLGWDGVDAAARLIQARQRLTSDPLKVNEALIGRSLGL